MLETSSCSPSNFPIPNRSIERDKQTKTADAKRPCCITHLKQLLRTRAETGLVFGVSNAIFPTAVAMNFQSDPACMLSSRYKYGFVIFPHVLPANVFRKNAPKQAAIFASSQNMAQPEQNLARS